MKSKILVVVIFIATIWACTTEPLLPDGFTGETADRTCADGIVSFQYEILPLISSVWLVATMQLQQKILF
jgi:hypothetical protein